MYLCVNVCVDVCVCVCLCVCRCSINFVFNSFVLLVGGEKVFATGKGNTGERKRGYYGKECWFRGRTESEERRFERNQGV